MALEKREDAVVVAETVDPPESPPAALDAVRLDTKNVSNDPTHAWFTHRPGTSPVAFANANPPTAVCPMRWPWVYARCLRRPSGAAAASEGNFVGKWMLMSVPDEFLDVRWVQTCAAVEAGEVRAAKVVPAASRLFRAAPLIAYSKRLLAVSKLVLRAGLALRARFGEVKLLYKPDVFTLCDQERLFETGPRGGGDRYRSTLPAVAGAVELVIVETVSGARRRNGGRAVGAADRRRGRRRCGGAGRRPREGTGHERRTHRAVARVSRAR